MTESEVVSLFVLVGVLFTAVVTVIVAVIAGRQRSTESVISDLRAELAATRAEVAANDRRIAALERRDKAWANYVHRLRRHITDGLGPPPPEWPADLDR
jgi:cell division protein FtsB